MRIKNYLKGIIGAVIAATALVSGSVNAETITGSVHWLSTNGNGYTFVNIKRTNGLHVVAYYTGTNSAIATVIDNAKRLNQNVTVVTDDNIFKIKQVR